MMQMVFRVVDLINTINWRKTHNLTDLQLSNPTIDESLIDMTLTECWVVFGPGLPVVNGSYQFQREHTKQAAEDFCQLINIISIQGGRWARGSMKQALGIADNDTEREFTWEMYEEAKSNRLQWKTEYETGGM